MPKLHLADPGRQAKLERWARFLRAQTAEELEELARGDAMMTTAKDALEELSSDPVAQRLASERETATLMHRHLINASREDARQVIVEAVRALCEILEIDIDAARARRMASLDCDRLSMLVQRLKTERRWPEQG